MVVNTECFVNRLSEKSKYPKPECEAFMKYFVAVICDSLRNGDRIKYRGVFDIFAQERPYYDPNTGELSERNAYIPYIRCGEHLKAAARMCNSETSEAIN